MTSRAGVITDFLNGSYFTPEVIEQLALSSESTISALNGLKNASDFVKETRDAISCLRKRLMAAIDAQDRDAVEKLKGELDKALDSISANELFKQLIEFGRKVRQSKLDDTEFALDLSGDSAHPVVDSD